jgi:hypothetical protein
MRPDLLKKLPDGSYKQILLEARDRGVKLLGPCHEDGFTLIVGLTDIVAELRETKAEKPNRLGPGIRE